MANTASAAKRARQTTRRTLQNRGVITGIKTQIKLARASVKAGGKEAAVKAAHKLAATADRAAKTGRIHKNKANRLKSRSAKALAKLA